MNGEEMKKELLDEEKLESVTGGKDVKYQNAKI